MDFEKIRFFPLLKMIRLAINNPVFKFFLICCHKFSKFASELFSMRNYLFFPDYSKISKHIIWFITCFLIFLPSPKVVSQAASLFQQNNEKIKVGAENTGEYLPLLKGKRVAVVANHTSLIQRKNLVDSLLSLGINIVKIFSPEHGFRGNIDAGEYFNDYKDSTYRFAGHFSLWQKFQTLQ